MTAQAEDHAFNAQPKKASNVITLHLADKAKLYSSYMPFVKNGGLFVPTPQQYSLGDEIFILLRLLDETEKFTLVGKVVWVSPKGGQGGRAAGIGIQFIDESAKNIRNKIEGYLAGALQSERRTDTM